MGHKECARDRDDKVIWLRLDPDDANRRFNRFLTGAVLIVMFNSSIVIVMFESSSAAAAAMTIASRPKTSEVTTTISSDGRRGAGSNSLRPQV